MKEFLIRTASAIMLIALVVGITLLPDMPFFIAFVLILSPAAWEMGNLIGGRAGFKMLAVLNFLVLLFSLKFQVFFFGILLVIFMTGFVSLLFTGRENVPGFLKDVSTALLPAVILAPTLFHIYLIWSLGKWFFYLIIFIISIGDTAAYLIGTAFGKHKIYPAASPNKSWEGFIAALFAGALAALPGAYLKIATPILPVIGFLTCLFAQISDPFESLFKRAAGVKDSSSIIPGHGGVLDRIDSYIFAAPIYYYLLLWLAK